MAIDKETKVQAQYEVHSPSHGSVKLVTCSRAWRFSMTCDTPARAHFTGWKRVKDA